MIEEGEAGKESGNSASQQVREDSEYARLVVSNEPRPAEADNLQPQADQRRKSCTWWINAILLSFIAIIFVLIFIRWGVPFIFEKVCYCCPGSPAFLFIYIHLE